MKSERGRRPPRAQGPHTPAIYASAIPLTAAIRFYSGPLRRPQTAPPVLYQRPESTPAQFPESSQGHARTCACAEMSRQVSPYWPRPHTRGQREERPCSLNITACLKRKRLHARSTPKLESIEWKTTEINGQESPPQPRTIIIPRLGNKVACSAPASASLKLRRQLWHHHSATLLCSRSPDAARRGCSFEEKNFKAAGELGTVAAGRYVWGEILPRRDYE